MEFHKLRTELITFQNIWHKETVSSSFVRILGESDYDGHERHYVTHSLHDK